MVMESIFGLVFQEAEGAPARRYKGKSQLAWFNAVIPEFFQLIPIRGWQQGMASVEMKNNISLV